VVEVEEAACNAGANNSFLKGDWAIYLAFCNHIGTPAQFSNYK
jgi:hypothetical protein